MIRKYLEEKNTDIVDTNYLKKLSDYYFDFIKKSYEEYGKENHRYKLH